MPLANGQFESGNLRRPTYAPQTTGIPKGRHYAAAVKLNDKLLREGSGFTRGDFAEERMMGARGRRGASPQVSRMLAQARKRQTPAAKELAAKRLVDARAKDVAEFNRIKLYNMTNTGTLNVNTIKDKPWFPELEAIRKLSMQGYYPAFFDALPYNKITNFTKFRFNWGPDGRPVFVPMTLDSWLHFFGSPDRRKFFRFKSSYECGENWIKSHAKDKFNRDQKSVKRYNNRSPLHVRAWNPSDFVCKKKKKSLWVKIRKVVVGAALVVAAVYLGPVIVAKVKSIAGGMIGGGAGGGGTAAGTAAGAAGGTGAAGTVAQVTTFQKIQAGTKTLLGYVNKARTIKAVVKGELPPPPIGIPGANFRDWAMIVAKQKIKEEAIDAAMSAGAKYIEKKMTAKEEAKLKAEIAEMQRQLIALTPPEVLAMPPEPDPELAEPMKKIQIIEEQRQANIDKFIVPGAIVAGALILGG